MMSTSARPNRSSACTTACGSVIVDELRYAVVALRPSRIRPGNRRSCRDFRARGRDRRSVRQALFLRTRERRRTRREPIAARCSRSMRDSDYRGRSRGLMVHKLPPVQARERDPARSHAEVTRRQYPELRGKSRAACASLGSQPARASCFTVRPERARRTAIITWRRSSRTTRRCSSRPSRSCCSASE